MRAYDVFVSHTARQSDRAVADAIVSGLEEAGRRCWIAPRDVMPGSVYAEEIVNAISASRLMVVIISNDANQSRHVHREVELAVTHDLPVIPFRIESVEPAGAMAYFLESAHWLDAMTPPLDRHIARLADVVAFTLERQKGRETATYAAAAGPAAASPAAPPAPAAPSGPAAPAGPAGPAAPAGPAGPAAPAEAVRGWSPRNRRIWIAAAVIALIGVATGLVLFFLPSTKVPTPPRPRSVATIRLKSGECLLTPRPYERSNASRRNFWTNTNILIPTVMTVISCRVPHSGEVIFGGDAWPVKMSYPGINKTADQAVSICYSKFQKYAGMPLTQSSLSILPYIPIKDEWSSGDRTLICMAYYSSGKNSRGTVRNSGR